MRSVCCVLSRCLGGVAASLAVLAMMTVPLHDVRAAVVTPGPVEDTTCADSNGQACTNNDTTNPTDCDSATKGKACDKSDTSCKCRFGAVSLNCACGY